MNRYTWKTFTLEVALIGFAAVFLFPIYILVNLAIRKITNLDTVYTPTTQPTLENFKDSWIEGGLFGAVVNSTIVTFSSVVFIVLFSSFASYPLARITSRWSKSLFFLVIGGLLIPYKLAFLPL